MHRPAAMDVPTAPIGHHWQDATHISFGVLTAGVFGRSWKAEGSLFNGHDPDENRWDIDRITLDSYSGRLTINPTANWSVSGGLGYLKSPELLHPGEPMHRVTASALHGATFGTDGQWASALIWGANKHPGRGLEHAVLAESEAILDRGNTILAHVELAQKSAEDPAVTLTFGSPDHTFSVWSATVGYIRELGRWQGTTIGLGATGTVNVVPSTLEKIYGSRTPLGALVFLRLRPFHTGGGHAMGGMKVTGLRPCLPLGPQRHEQGSGLPG